MGSRLKLVVAYDGAPFAGWQSQKNGQAVQDHLERAFAVVVGEKIRVHGAGRTDAGVHALGQTAHVELAGRSLDPSQWTAALNNSLDPRIRVLRCRYMPSSFHARFSAQGKVYRYRIWNDRILPPLEVGRAWQIARPLQLETMIAEAGAFVGRHDFSSFAANRGVVEQETERTIRSVQVKRQGRVVTVEVSGEGFLYKMVRLMVGALARVGWDEARAGEIAERLREPQRAWASSRLVAPAGGLILIRVRY